MSLAIAYQLLRSSLPLYSTRASQKLLSLALTTTLPVKQYTRSSHSRGQCQYLGCETRSKIANFVDREFEYDPNNETGLIKELIGQVGKVIGNFASPKKVYIVSDLPKTRSGKVRVFFLSFSLFCIS